MKYLLLALFIPSLSFGTPVRQTGVSGVNMTGFAIITSSEPAADIDVSSTVANGISTVTASNRGSRPAWVTASGTLNNTSGGSKTYTCGIYQNGVLLDQTQSSILLSGATYVLFLQKHISSTNQGATNYVLICASTASNSGQVIQNVHVTSMEF